MEFIGIVFALFYAVILTAIFSFIFRNTGPWNGFWIFFFLLFFIALGAGEWSRPVGPVVMGYYWIPGLLAAIIFALILAAATPASRSSRNTIKNAGTEKVYKEEETAEAVLAIGAFFWILIIVLIIVAITGVM